MAIGKQFTSERAYANALQHLQCALRLLDEASAPAHIGAQVDLAIHALYDIIAKEMGKGSLDRADRNGAPE